MGAYEFTDSQMATFYVDKTNFIVSSGRKVTWDPVVSQRSYWFEWTDSLTNSTWSRSPYSRSSSTPYFIDTDWTNHPNRFYRIAVEKNP